MKKNLELRWEDLKISYLNTGFNFKTTDEIQPDEGIIDQDNALMALEFGLQLGARGYNMYISGVDQKTIYDYVKARLEKQAREKDVPQDICYIYNFKNPSTPKVIRMQPGDSIHFKEDMKEFRQFLIDGLGAKLDSLEAERKRHQLIDKLETKKEQLLEELKNYAKEQGFVVKLTQEGLGFMPFDKEEKPLSMEQYEMLDQSKKQEMEGMLDKLSEMAEQVLADIKEIEKEYSQYMNDISEGIVLNEVGYFIKHLKEAYGKYDVIKEYLDEILQDILEDVSVFSEVQSDESQDLKNLFPWIGGNKASERISHYDINILVDNSKLQGAPVITARDLSFAQLVGKIKVDTELTLNRVDFNNISAGLLHEANGGYLLLYVNDLLDYPGAFEVIRRTLKTGEVNLESLALSNITTSLGVLPPPVPVDFKVILIGDYEIYRLLCDTDATFKELFKINIDFKDTIDGDRNSLLRFASQIKAFCNKEHLPDVSHEGILILAEYSHRLAESQEKMSANIQPVTDLVREASVFGGEVITRHDIIRAKKIKNLFKETLQKNIEEKYAKNVYLLDVKGKKVGQVNGLAVYDVGDFRFGKPVRITATTYRGKSGVVDIEGAVGLSGSIHSKGVQIITGFLGNYFAQDYPLSLCGKICFEQSYGGIDGDSASSAELYAILSSLAHVPIRQGIAVTGSINQYGQIQPVGGVNDKIEGFYRICKEKGLTGKQGVIIPQQNQKDLVLDEEVIDAVEKGKFHIYAITSFKEGIEILTGLASYVVEERVAYKLKLYSSEEKNKSMHVKKK